MKQWETIILEKSDRLQGVYIIALDRPDSMNALNTQMGYDLIECLKMLKKQSDCRVLLLTGSGEKAFCVGADLKERNGMTKEDWKNQHDIFEEVTLLIREFPFPVLALLNGYALGGGFEIALSCDMRIAASNVKLGFPEVKIGILPGIGGTQLLTRLVPTGLAKELLFSGKQISASEAEKIGLINKVISTDNNLEEALSFVKNIAKNAPISLQQIKMAVNAGSQVDLTTALKIELQAYYKCADSEDRLEGIQAFNDKREPVWQGK
ncbi:enoyl-CoA hydratase/isomerase family protein [Peribacillus sp. TH14]|uniref:enoyl-CoA hydratase/isomerase family protein n=1 Tax=Peribacillus sp. TH14 TaxID=2798481 RepID=UPI0019146640|nr:enoyl-CoA hydratase-related protein [Peribacillus sp. TH14]MBK5502684.1 enoyl-CoA hydratase/isomerase family protein [Peribacillus sp. TH14]